MDIGFIGLGAMGKAMAANLLQAGHRLTVWNRSPAPVEALVALGATAAAAPAAACRGEAVISMFADDRAIRETLLEPGLVERMPRETVHVNMATISVALARELAARHRAAGSAYVGAPVFGRPDAAAAAKLHILAAGDPAAIARVQPLFDAMGQRTWSFGVEPERANVVKVAGNFLIAAAIEALGEAAAMTEAQGVAGAEFLDLMMNTLFDCRVYRNYGTIIAAGNYEPPGFKLVLGLKDIKLALAAGEEVDVPMPTASLVRDSYLDAIAHGDGEKDWAALATVAARRAALGERS
ncbi:MAG: NAD(P)-dependent oxidoreductase [Gammaproteobacteria bacterium]|nr:NAD(P)-dependent oxidoreductase [Gammaproteobacteria bacterium]MBI5619316.1 NAD(P)-dependent oxidoreductase [Gammaproteobacteria bacterium]